MTITQLRKLSSSRELGKCFMPAHEFEGTGCQVARLSDIVKHSFSLLASDGAPAVIAIAVFGSAVAMPQLVTRSKRKYWLFGKKYTWTSLKYPRPSDIDVAVICRENQFNQKNLAGEIRTYYDGAERLSQNIHLVYIGLEELRKSSETSTLAAHILQSGFVIAGDENVDLGLLCRFCGLERNPVKIRADWTDDGSTVGVHLRYTQEEQQKEVQEEPPEPEEPNLLDQLLST